MRTRLFTKFFALALSASLGGIPELLAKSGAAFLTIDPSPRSYAMGGTNSVMAFGAQAIGANPANLGVVNRKFEAFSSFSNLVNDQQYSHIAFAINRNTTRRHLIEGLGLSLTNLSVTGGDSRDRTGAKTGGSVSALDRAISLTASSLVSTNLRLGATGKFIQSELAGYRSGLTLAGDFGLNYDIKRDRMPVSLGMSLRNMGQGIRYLNQTDSLPTSLDAGLGVGVGPGTFVMELSQLLADRKTHFAFGMEFGMGPVSLRAGMNSGAGQTYNKDKISSVIQNFSSGLGIKMGNMKLDYSLSGQVGDFGLTHRAALSLQWGASLTKPRPKIYGPLHKNQY